MRRRSCGEGWSGSLRQQVAAGRQQQAAMLPLDGTSLGAAWRALQVTLVACCELCTALV